MPRFARNAKSRQSAVDLHDVRVAQYDWILQGAPYLYVSFFLSTAAVSWTFFDVAPLWLSVFAAGILYACFGLRLLAWFRNRRIIRNEALTENAMRAAGRIAPAMASAFVCWYLAMAKYGGPDEIGHSIVFVCSALAGMIFSVLLLPRAVFGILAVACPPVLAYYAFYAESRHVYVVVGVLLALVLIVRAIHANFDALLSLVISRAEVGQKQIETQRLSEENARLANTDVLTGLPNRRYLLQMLECRLDEALASERSLGLCVIDVDHFMRINDTFGYVVGDALLDAISRRIEQNLSGGMMLARLGGDVFGLIVEKDPSCDEMADVAGRICESVLGSFHFDKIVLTVTVSCGIAIGPQAGTTAHRLLDRADYALRLSKAGIRGTATVFSPLHEISIREEREVEIAMHSERFADELEIYFQPIIDLETGRMSGAEALGRWTSQTIGTIAPDRFVAVAERTGTIHALTLILFGKALGTFPGFSSRLRMAFNLSAHDITSHQTILAIIAMIRRSGVDPSLLVFELTETSLVRSFDSASTSITALHHLGAKIALDDFGTGYSSLGYLHRLPLDKVKIDRSFVAGVETPQGRNIVAAIIGMCANLQLSCVVEGIETADQLAVLREIGCRQAQGYYFGKPMPLAEFKDWQSDWLARLAQRDERQPDLFELQPMALRHNR